MTTRNVQPGNGAGLPPVTTVPPPNPPVGPPNAAPPAPDPTEKSNLPAVAPKVTAVSDKLGLRLNDKGQLDIPSYGVVLAQSGFFPDIQRASQGIVKILLGQELGYPPITSTIGIHIIRNENKGTVSVMIGSKLKVGKIKASGRYDYKVIEHTREKCALEALVMTTKGWEARGRVEFTVEDAKSAFLGGFPKFYPNDQEPNVPKFDKFSNWGKYPRRMLFARAAAELEATFFPDITTVATYTPDELGYSEDANGEAIVVAGNLVPEPGSDAPAAPIVDVKAAAAEVIKKREPISNGKITKLDAIARDAGIDHKALFDLVDELKGWADPEKAAAAREQQDVETLFATIADASYDAIIGAMKKPAGEKQGKLL